MSSLIFLRRKDHFTFAGEDKFMKEKRVLMSFK